MIGDRAIQIEKGCRVFFRMPGSSYEQGIYLIGNPVAALPHDTEAYVQLLALDSEQVVYNRASYRNMYHAGCDHTKCKGGTKEHG